MMDRQIHHEQPMAFFKQLVDQVMADQQLQASEESSFYLVKLLDDFVRPEGPLRDVGTRPEQPLGELWLTAQQVEGPRRFALLKLTGDLALFLSGFFSDSLDRRLVDVEYYFFLGERAYGSAAVECRPRSGGELFEELAARFVQLAEVLHGVSEQCVLAGDHDLLRLYDRWRATGSRHGAEALARRGVGTGPPSDLVH